VIQVKNSRDIAYMRKAGNVAHRALTLAGSLVAEGVTTWDIDMAVREFLKKERAVPTFLNYNGYPMAINVSINEEGIHGIPRKDRVIKKGDIVSIDIGATVDGYVGDNAWTFAVEPISEEARHLMDVTEKALELGIAQARKGNRVGDISHAVQTWV